MLLPILRSIDVDAEEKIDLVLDPVSTRRIGTFTDIHKRRHTRTKSVLRNVFPISYDPERMVSIYFVYNRKFLSNPSWSEIDLVRVCRLLWISVNVSILLVSCNWSGHAESGVVDFRGSSDRDGKIETEERERNVIRGKTKKRRCISLCDRVEFSLPKVLRNVFPISYDPERMVSIYFVYNRKFLSNPSWSEIDLVRVCRLLW
jgi:hypothetical protein